MKNQVCTALQMLILKMFGVDDSNASMCRIETNLSPKASDDSLLVENNDYYGNKLPVFTIADMLNRIPETLENQMTFNFQIYKDGDWHCRYYCIDYDVFTLCSHRPLLKDAVYDVFKELAKQGKLISDYGKSI